MHEIRRDCSETSLLNYCHNSDMQRNRSYRIWTLFSNFHSETMFSLKTILFSNNVVLHALNPQPINSVFFFKMQDRNMNNFEVMTKSHREAI